MTREVVIRFWERMAANDWGGAAALLAVDCPVDWICSGERFVGREAFVSVQERYPTRTGYWHFEVHRVVVDGDVAVSEVSVGDGEQAARVVVFSTVSDGLVSEQVEYWPASYDPPPGREDLAVPGPVLP